MKKTIANLVIMILAFAALSFALTQVVVVSPSTNQNVSGTIIINATTVGNATNATFYFYDSSSGVLVFNTTILNDTAADTMFNSTLDTTLLSDGFYNLTVNATNSTGDVLSNNTITLVGIDNTAPNVFSFVSPVSNANLSSGDQLFNVTINDTTLRVDTVLFNITNASSSVLLTASNPVNDYWNATYNVSLLAEEQHTLTVIANDTAGNLNNSQTLTFIVDRTAPNVSIETTNATSTTDTTPTIAFNFTDSLSASASCTLYSSGTAYGTSSSVANATSSSLTFNASLGVAAHTYNVNCTDGSGNQGASATNTITITQAASSSSSSSSSSSGGGGGSYSGSTQTTKVWPRMEKGDKITLPISGEKVGVSAIDFSTNKQVAGSWMQVKQKKSLLSSMKPVGIDVFKYFEVTASSNLVGAMDDISIHFFVTRDWLDEAGIAAQGVRLLRYHDDEWQVLDTQWEETTDEKISFVATTPGFSYFAIAGDESVSAPAASQVEQQEEDALDSTTPAPEDQEQEAETTQQQGEEQAEQEEIQEDNSLTWLWVVLILIALGVVGWYFLVKKK